MRWVKFLYQEFPPSVAAVPIFTHYLLQLAWRGFYASEHAFSDLPTICPVEMAGSWKATIQKACGWSNPSHFCLHTRILPWEEPQTCKAIHEVEDSKLSHEYLVTGWEPILPPHFWHCTCSIHAPGNILKITFHVPFIDSLIHSATSPFFSYDSQASPTRTSRMTTFSRKLNLPNTSQSREMKIVPIILSHSRCLRVHMHSLANYSAI